VISPSEKFNVYIPSEEEYGYIESLGAFVSEVSYTKNGVVYKEMIENEDFVIIDEESN
jgi:hypothetical protein